jgi:hypothetical protein
MLESYTYTGLHQRLARLDMARKLALVGNSIGVLRHLDVCALKRDSLKVNNQNSKAFIGVVKRNCVLKLRFSSSLVSDSS